MATVTVTIGAQTKSWTVSDADITRIIESYRLQFGQVLDGTLEPPAYRDRTDAEIFDMIADDCIDGMKAVVMQKEGEVAAAAAIAAVTPVVATE